LYWLNIRNRTPTEIRRLAIAIEFALSEWVMRVFDYIRGAVASGRMEFSSST